MCTPENTENNTGHDDPHDAHDAGAFPNAELAARMDRRSLLKVAGAGGAAVALSTAGGFSAAAADGVPRKKRAYVVVIDGCRPEEINGEYMPLTSSLRAHGTWYPRARSLPIMETIPNHVMMMTGVRPDRNGIPANEIYDRRAGEVRKMDRPGDIRAQTIIRSLNDTGRTTGTVLSKTYLYSVFGSQATHRWEPGPIVPISGHAPDSYTMDAALAMIRHQDPDFMFVNMGSVDRMGHMDIAGTTLRLARKDALRRADEQLKRFVNLLKGSGRWEDSMIIVLADHSMDWSDAFNVISLTWHFEQDESVRGKYEIAQNGGADLVYWTGPAAERHRGVRRLRDIALEQDGVMAAHVRSEAPQLRLGPNAGDLVCYASAGWRFADPNVFANPIPGNHGHPVTQPIPFFIAGGHPMVRQGVQRTAYAATMDVAPTVGRFFGVTAPRTGWEGVNRL